MARHVTIVTGELIDGNVETDTLPTTSLAKKVYDVVNGKSAYDISIAKQGQNAAVIICYDD
jgi:hypothetical protein